MASRPQLLATGLATAGAVLAFAAPPSAAASPPPHVDRTMEWYRWDSSSWIRQKTGSTALLGVRSMGELAALRTRYGLWIIRSFPPLRAVEVRVTHSLLAHAAGDRGIRYISTLEDEPRRLMSMPNDPLVSTVDRLTELPYEWQFGASHLDRALDLSPGRADILVGTIDSGAADVPDLKGKVDQRWSVSQSGDLTRDAAGVAGDVVGHGTAVASLIAANVGDGFGMAGFGGAAHLIVVRAWKLTDLATAVALMKLDGLGVRIVNMSFGIDALEQPIMVDAMHRAESDGMLLVAAAGNSSHAVAHPAADLQPAGGTRSDGLAVGASDVHGRLAFFSNSGANLSLLAPGGGAGPCTGVLVAGAGLGNGFDGSCYPSWSGTGGAEYAYVSGTSFAAPEVAGVAALVWAARPELANYQVAGIIKQSARRTTEGWTPALGCGVLDAAAAVELALSRSAVEWAAAPAPTSACSTS